jgi:hypothetical protein
MQAHGLEKKIDNSQTKKMKSQLFQAYWYISKLDKA